MLAARSRIARRPQAEPSRLIPKLASLAPDWLRAGSSPAARHTLDHSAQRPLWPTKATNPAAATVATPRIWTSLAPWVRASRGAISASNPAIWRFRAAIVASMAARVAGLPAVAAGWAGSAELARVISRLARGRASRQPRAAKTWRSSAGLAAAIRAGVQPSANSPTTTRPALVSKGR